MLAGARSYSLSVPSSGVLDTMARRTPAWARIDSARSGVYTSQSGRLKWMWASKSGSWAAAGAAPSRTTSSARSRRLVMAAMVTPRSRGRPAHPATPVANAARVVQRREHDLARRADARGVGAAAPAHDPRRRAADQRRRRALQRQQARLERAAEGVVPPRAVAAYDAVARHDDRDGVGAERVADGARRARMADRAGQRGVRGHLAERHPRGGGQHAGLERRKAGQVQRHREERARAGEILGQLAPRALEVAPAAPRGDVAAPAVAETTDARVARLQREALGERGHAGAGTTARPREQAPAQAGGSGGREELGEGRVERVHWSSPQRPSSAAFKIDLPRASWLFTVLTEMPRTAASSPYDRPST